MFRIKVLGGLRLEREGRRLEGLGPRRGALLAALAVAGDKGLSRDRLLLFLWPDTTEEKARHNLAQAVYSLHKQVGAEVLQSSGNELRLDAALVSSDVGDLLAAHAACDAERVAALYDGPFLDGFILPDAAEFDEWAALERTRLEQLAREAIETTARLALEANDPSAAAAWRRLTALDPLATRYALGLARALAAANDPGAAVRHLNAHVGQLQAELGVPAPAEVTELIGELTRPASVQPAAAPPSTPAPLLADQPDAPAPEQAPPSAVPIPTRPPSSPARRSIMAIAALAAAGFTALAAWNARRPVRDLTGGAMVVLTDVENLTRDSSLGPALRAAVDVALGQSSQFSVYPRAQLRQSLARMGRAIRDTVLTESLAREVALRESGAAVVAISIAEVGGRFSVSSRIVDPPSARTLAARQVRVDAAEQLLDAVSDIAAWTRGRLGDAAAGSAPRLPLVTTSSLDALIAFANGNEALGRGDWGIARRLLDRAVELDTGFAMAHASLGVHYLFTNNIPEALRWLGEARKRIDRLTEPERLNVELHLAQAEGRNVDAIAHSRALAVGFPSARHWRAYGEALRAAGRDEEAIGPLERAAAIDSTNPLSHLFLALAHRGVGNFRDALDHYGTVDRLDSLFLMRDYHNQQWGATFVLIGDMAGAEAVFRRMAARPAAADRARGHRSLAYLALYRGRFRDAVRELRAAIPLQPRGTLSEYRDLVLLADAERTLGNDAAADAALDRVFEIFRRTHIQAAAVMFAGHQLVRARQLPRARLLLDSLAARAALRPAHEQDQAALAILRADLALAAGRPPDAVEPLARPAFAAYDALGFHLRAEMFAGLDRLDSAMAMAKRATEQRVFGIETQMDWLRSFATLARLAEAAGDSATARGAWSSLIELWKDGDPDLPPLIVARGELTRLQAAVGR